MESTVDGFLLLTKPYSIHKFSQRRIPASWNPKTPNLYSGYLPLSKSAVSTRCNRRDSNAEPFGSPRFSFKFRDNNNAEDQGNDLADDGKHGGGGGGSRRKRKKRQWLGDKPPPVLDEEEDPGIFEEALDSIWIFKVFKSYGWALPPITISLLLATGPKAFLMALALPLGQSAVTFAFQKLFGKTKSKPKSKAKKRRKSSVSSSLSDTEMDYEEREENKENVKGKMGYHSWVVKDNGSVNKDHQDDAPRFGGWDELDGMGSTQHQRPPRMGGRSRRKPLDNDRLSMGGRKSDTPLLLRLLIAVFPFLGSWTKML